MQVYISIISLFVLVGLENMSYRPEGKFYMVNDYVKNIRAS